MLRLPSRGLLGLILILTFVAAAGAQSRDGADKVRLRSQPARSVAVPAPANADWGRIAVTAVDAYDDGAVVVAGKADRPAHGGEELFVVKVFPDGEARWLYRHPVAASGRGGYDFTDVVAEFDGGALAVGTSEAASAFPDDRWQWQVDGTRAWVVRFDATGRTLWQRYIGEPVGTRYWRKSIDPATRETTVSWIVRPIFVRHRATAARTLGDGNFLVAVTRDYAFHREPGTASVGPIAYAVHGLLQLYEIDRAGDTVSTIDITDPVDNERAVDSGYRTIVRRVTDMAELPDGTILLGKHRDGGTVTAEKIMNVDRDGRRYWQLQVPRGEKGLGPWALPRALAPLADGTVAALIGNTAVRLDQAGNIYWSFNDEAIDLQGVAVLPGGARVALFGHRWAGRARPLPWAAVVDLDGRVGWQATRGEGEITAGVTTAKGAIVLVGAARAPALHVVRFPAASH